MPAEDVDLLAGIDMTLLHRFASPAACVYATLHVCIHICKYGVCCQWVSVLSLKSHMLCLLLQICSYKDCMVYMDRYDAAEHCTLIGSMIFRMCKLGDLPTGTLGNASTCRPLHSMQQCSAMLQPSSALGKRQRRSQGWTY